VTDVNAPRLIRRQTLSGDIFYDVDTREVYRDGSVPTNGTIKDFSSIATFDSRSPLKVYFDFTYLCNLECSHCITNSSPRVDRQNELPYERIVYILNDLAAIGVLEIGIGGGEPLCYPDIFQLLDQAKAIELNVVLTTNGLLVTAETANRLKDTQVSEVRVSFDGSQSVHDAIRGAGTYRKALEAVKILVHNGVTPVPRITVCHDDELGLDGLFRDLAATGASTVKAGLLEPRGRASLEENQYLFRYQRDVVIGKYLLELAQKHGLNLKLPDDLAISSELADGGDLRRGVRKCCGAGLETAYISPYGDVHPCSGMPNQSFGDVRSNSFISAWTGDGANTWRQCVCTHDSWRACSHTEPIEGSHTLP